MEGVGPLRAVPFEQLRSGTYIVNETDPFNMCPDLPYGCPDLENVFIEYSDAVNEAAASGELPNAQAAMIIEKWQPGTLQKTTLRINWEEGGQPLTYSKDVFIHIARNPGNAR